MPDIDPMRIADRLPVIHNTVKLQNRACVVSGSPSSRGGRRVTATTQTHAPRPVIRVSFQPLHRPGMLAESREQTRLDREVLIAHLGSVPFERMYGILESVVKRQGHPDRWTTAATRGWKLASACHEFVHNGHARPGGVRLCQPQCSSDLRRRGLRVEIANCYHTPYGALTYHSDKSGVLLEAQELLSPRTERRCLSKEFPGRPGDEHGVIESRSLPQ